MDGESQNAKDARVEKLWQELDTAKEGELDLNGLKKGLKKIDHPLKNADDLILDVLNVVDTSKDGRIQYPEFRTFVEQTEKELWRLFKSIDRDHNGQLDKNELQLAFSRAGLRIPKSKLDQFFSEIDKNHDGVISFDEWRDFLLFIPAHVPSLKAVLSYYSSTVTVNSEGDVHISDETAEGLGTHHQFLNFLFGSIIIIAKPPRSKAPPQQSSSTAQVAIQVPPEESNPNLFVWDPGEESPNGEDAIELPPVLAQECKRERPKLLTTLLPDSGYFVAGGVAGVVSRTATAPLDRLKVYLIAQTGVRDETIRAAKSASLKQTTKAATRPLVDACKELWNMGGMRSLFAGNGLNVVKVMPESAIKFGSYEASKRAMARLEGHDDTKSLAPWSQFLAAGMGGIISQFCVYPLDTLKFRMQCETTPNGLHGNALIKETVRKMWATSGVRSFYRGLPMGIVGMFPYSAIDLTTFEYLKRTLVARNARIRQCHEEDAAPGNFATAFIGAFSGAFGASAVYPLNLLRTRLQSQGTAIHPPRYDGMWDVTVKTVSREGFRGLFKGLTPNLLKVVPAVSITYVVYDNSKRVMGLS